MITSPTIHSCILESNKFNLISLSSKTFKSNQVCILPLCVNKVNRQHLLTVLSHVVNIRGQCYAYHSTVSFFLWIYQAHHKSQKTKDVILNCDKVANVSSQACLFCLPAEVYEAPHIVTKCSPLEECPENDKQDRFLCLLHESLYIQKR